MKTNSNNTRLNRRLVELGLADSRRKADEQINLGLVEVNGKIAIVGQLVLPSDSIKLQGKSGDAKKNDITIKLNKPEGYVSSHVAQGNYKTIFDFLPKSFSKLKIAGRLDQQSCGLMILSSNGQLIQKLSHPSNNKSKIYLVKINQPISDVKLKELEKGVKLKDGVSHFTHIKLIDTQTLRLTLNEGRNRQIRRTFEQLGLKVYYLQRLQIGNIKLGSLQPKKYEFINQSDLKELF